MENTHIMARYIVNHGGTLHSVNDDEFTLALGNASIPPSKENPAGSPAREATVEEVTAWWAAQGFVYDPATGDATPGKGKASK